MSIIRVVFVLLSLFAFNRCSTTGSYVSRKQLSPKAENCQLEVFMPEQSIKKEFDVIGMFSVQDTGFSVFCGWEAVLAKNKKNACSKGADAIQFVSVDTPSGRSTCYRSKANFIRFKNYHFNI